MIVVFNMCLFLFVISLINNAVSSTVYTVIFLSILLLRCLKHKYLLQQLSTIQI